MAICRMSESPQGNQSHQSSNRQQGRRKQQSQSGQNQRQSNQRRQQDPSRPHVLDDESILVETRPSWTVFVWQILTAILLVLAGIIASGQTGSQGVLVGTVVIALLMFAWIWYRRRRVRYVITDRRAMIVTGISAKKTNEIWLMDARSMQTGASLLERLLGHGTVILSEATLTRSSLNVLGAIPILGTLPIFNAGRGLTFGGIKEPTRVANIIRKRQSALKDRK